MQRTAANNGQRKKLNYDARAVAAWARRFEKFDTNYAQKIYGRIAKITGLDENMIVPSIRRRPDPMSQGAAAGYMQHEHAVYVNDLGMANACMRHNLAGSSHSQEDLAQDMYNQALLLGVNYLFNKNQMPIAGNQDDLQQIASAMGREELVRYTDTFIRQQSLAGVMGIYSVVHATMTDAGTRYGYKLSESERKKIQSAGITLATGTMVACALGASTGNIEGTAAAIAGFGSAAVVGIWTKMTQMRAHFMQNKHIYATGVISTITTKDVVERFGEDGYIYLAMNQHIDLTDSQAAIMAVGHSGSLSYDSGFTTKGIIEVHERLGHMMNFLDRAAGNRNFEDYYYPL